jgi:hypothetical protein
MMKRTKGGSWIIENGKIFDSEIGVWETRTWENNPYEIIKREKAEQKEIEGVDTDETFSRKTNKSSNSGTYKLSETYHLNKKNEKF